MRSHRDQGSGRDLPGFMGVLPPCFTIPNADLTTQLPRSGSTTHIVRKIHSSIYHTTRDFQGAGAPSLLSSHSPHISYNRRSPSNALEHRLRPATNTTTKRPCSSGREPDGRDQFHSRPQSFDLESNAKQVHHLTIFYPNLITISTHGRPCWHARAQLHRIQKKDVTC
ncbi:hypothetical protein GBA52_014954 [Prunus armeniaca]|nr:hypothetical protein GBA52_014954 [Prunus armeniaca]